MSDCVNWSGGVDVSDVSFVWSGRADVFDVCLANTCQVGQMCLMYVLQTLANTCQVGQICLMYVLQALVR